MFMVVFKVFETTSNAWEMFAVNVPWDVLASIVYVPADVGAEKV